MFNKDSKTTKSAQFFLGLTFVVFGLNGFFHFMPQPEPTPEGGAFLGALAATGYMFPLIKGTEVVAGLLLVLGIAPSLALVVLTPVLVNIVAYHVALDPGGSALGVLLSAVTLALAWARRDDYRGLFTPSSYGVGQRTLTAPAARA